MPTEARMVSFSMAGLTYHHSAKRMLIAWGAVRVHLTRNCEKRDVAPNPQQAANAILEGFDDTGSF